jgi:hypothetical protein
MKVHYGFYKQKDSIPFHLLASITKLVIHATAPPRNIPSIRIERLPALQHVEGDLMALEIPVITVGTFMEGGTHDMTLVTQLNATFAPSLRALWDDKTTIFRMTVDACVTFSLGICTRDTVVSLSLRYCSDWTLLRQVESET